MNNNDVLRRLRYAFDLNDNKMIAIFELADYPVTREQVSAWLKKDDDPELVKCRDYQLAVFLNGLISDKRGKREGEQPEPEKRLNNNIILRKLRIALNYKDEDILSALELVHFKLSKHELSAFFRKREHKHFRECKDQVLRNFLKGITAILRKDSDPEFQGPKPTAKPSPKPAAEKPATQPVKKGGVSTADIWGKKKQ